MQRELVSYDSFKSILQIHIGISRETASFSLFFEGRENITKFLIENGAEVDIRNTLGKTPLAIAAMNGNILHETCFIHLDVFVSICQVGLIFQ